MFRVSIKFLFTAYLVGLFSQANHALAQEGSVSFEKVVQPFLQKHCVACHGPEKQRSQVRFDQVKGYRMQDQHLWTAVHEMLSSGQMPPKARSQPADAEKKSILTWIEKEAATAKKALGTGSTRRLNRRELSAALQDLTGLAIDYAEALPGDGKVGGFDTGAEGLQDAADSVAHLLQITRRAVDGIRFLEPAPDRILTADLRQGKDARKAFDAWKDQGAVAKSRGTMKPGVGLLIEPKWVGERGGLSFTVPTRPNRRGVLRMKLVVSAIKPLPGIPNSRLWVEVGGKDIDFREITNTPDKPVELVYEVQLDDLAVDARGANITLSNRVEVPYSIAGFENEDKTRPGETVPGGTGWFRPLFDRKGLPPDKQPVPFVVLHRIEIEPDYVATWPPASWQVQIGKISDDPQVAQRLFTLWIERAWRRPVKEAEQERFLTLYRQLREQGMSFDESLRATFQSVLLSGRFRYLSSPADPNPVIAQHAIASRLSFMLWGAPPDDELRRLAAAGKLRQVDVLDAQVDRLLSDPRSDAFLRPFITQWLEMGQPITVAMDHIKKQDFRFARYLKASMREETIVYLAQLFAENRPAQELIHSDWTMMNDILAIHYGYKGIDGGHLRRVKLRSDDARGGGILAHAGLQSMLCWMGENWVIYRGAWALRHILDDPPPPPPLEVPELIPSEKANHGKTFKQLLQQHQNDANCAVCHRKIDPLGFAFQNFDISGRWRELEYDSYAMNELDGKIEWRGVGKTRPVDAVGRLPRGEEFRSYDEFKQLIIKNYLPDVVRGLLKNLTIYATGRKPDVADMAEIKATIKELGPKGYPLRDLVKSVVRSKAFLDH